MMKNLIKRIIRKLYNVAAYEAEGKLASIYWGQIFNSTIVGSRWYKNQAISPGRWAVGYEFLYVLYRILDEVRPKSILELGLGQSTKLTSQYANQEQIKHIVVEHDPDWKAFFEKGWSDLSKYTEICVSPLKEVCGIDNKYYEYQNFGDIVGTQKYNLILVDGPWGGNGCSSRRDVLHILPEILEEDFVMMFDDCGRLGEETSVTDAEKILQKNGISYAKGIYNGGGIKVTMVLTSESLKFLCSL